MRPARGVVVAAALGFVVGALGAGALSEPVPASSSPRIVLDCPRLAEDAAAHVRLERYIAGELVEYRCERGGY